MGEATSRAREVDGPATPSPHKMSIREVVEAKAQRLLALVLARTSHRVRMVIGLLILIIMATLLTVPHYDTVKSHVSHYIPHLSIEYAQQATKFNESKVALLIENRPNPILAPLMLHFMAVVPPDWRFRFMGSVESVESINQSVAIREHVAAGKLDLTYIPANMSTGSQEEISRFLTTLWLYEVVLQPAEWLLIFQTDSVLCANSRQTLNDYLDYDWVGAPWSRNSIYGGNGGLSLRRVSAMIDVLRDQVRLDGTEPEDVWLTTRLGHRPGSRMANGTVSMAFSGESLAGEKTSVLSSTGNADGLYNNTLDAAAVAAAEYVEGIDDWRNGFYEPMGYHTGSGGRGNLHGGIWGKPELRQHVWNYCPEIKMTLQMDAAKYVPGHCHQEWNHRRSNDFDYGPDATDLAYGTEIIDGEEYPLLPPGLAPW